MAKEWKPTIEESASASKRVRGTRRSDFEGQGLSVKQIGIALIFGVFLGLIGAVIPWDRIGFHDEEKPPLSRKAAAHLLAVRNQQRLGTGGMPVESDASAVRPHHSQASSGSLDIADMGMVVAATPDNESGKPRP